MPEIRWETTGSSQKDLKAGMRWFCSEDQKPFINKKTGSTGICVLFVAGGCGKMTESGIPELEEPVALNEPTDLWNMVRSAPYRC